jgi:spore coat polysaccharide biosynthesis protein SpsF
MEDGQLNNTVGFVIQVRMGSTRFPRKSLMPIPLYSDIPLLKRITDCLQKTKFKSKIVVATSNNKENDSIHDFCSNNNIDCYRGDEDNVLSRFIEITKKNNFSCVVRLTGDNPIFDISILDNVIETHLKKENDYTKTVNLPIGMNHEVISSNSLLQMNKVELLDELEHVTLNIIRNSKIKKEEIFYDLPKEISSLRLTIDYYSDFLLLSTIFGLFDKNKLNGLEGIRNVYDKYPWIFTINAENEQLNI